MPEKIDSNVGYFLAGPDYRLTHRNLLRTKIR